ncbi:hypothetical protein Tco_0378298, partial [Tanacetum coccineum]
DLEHLESMEFAQKAKVKWSIDGDENSKIFHGILNKKRSQVAILGILVNGEWIYDPVKVKHGFFQHFKERFDSTSTFRLILDDDFPNQITSDQNEDLEGDISHEEIKRAIWDYGMDKSPGPDGWVIPKRGSILVNGSPTKEFQFKKDLKQEDPLSLFLFLLIMESLHISFNRMVNAGLFKGLHIVQVLKCFYHVSDLRINMHKSKLMGLCVAPNQVENATSQLGCTTFSAPLTYLGVKWIWRFKTQNSIWARFIKAIYGDHSSIDHFPNSSRSSTWLDIVQEFHCLKLQGTDLMAYCVKKVGNRVDTMFWGDPWMGEVPLKIQYPRLYDLETNKGISVAEKIGH